MPGRVDFSAELILVCNSLDAGGIERVVSTLANEWSRRGRKVAVVTLHDRKRFYTLDPAIHHVIVEQKYSTFLAQLLAKPRVFFAGLSGAKPWLLSRLGASLCAALSDFVYRAHFTVYLTFETWGLRRVLKRIDSPVVVAFGSSINIITLKACKGTGRRVIVSERTDPATLIELWGKRWRKYYQQADTVTANTRRALHDMGDYVGLAKMAFVPNPVALTNAKSNGNGKHAASAVKTSPFILTVGRLVDDKALDILLEAFARASDDFKEWRLSVVGEGLLGDSLRAQAQALGIAGRVDWHGVVRDPYLFYRAAHVFALPSRVEGTPNALLEAMSCGLAVVVSDGAPGPLELVEDGVTGLVVPVNDPVQLAAALRRLGNDGALRRRLGAAARERVTEYDLPSALATWESVVGLTCQPRGGQVARRV
jgi:glycosyltransferase involved in cell wall biosynthesis